MKKIKVLYITNIPSPNRVDFFNLLSEKCNLTVIYERLKADDRDKIWKSNSNGKYVSVVLNGKKLFVDGAFSFEIIKYLDRNQFDIIVIGGYSMPSAMLAIQYMKMKRIPYVLNSDGGYVKNDKKIVKAIKHHFIAGAEAYLSTCVNGDKQLIYYGAEKERIFRYSFTGQNEAMLLKEPLSVSEKESYREKLGISGKKIVLSVGRALHLKGYDLLIKAVHEKRINDAEFYIIGGDALEECTDLIEEYEIRNIHFLPFVDADTVEKYYRAADIFVLPTRSDAWGLVINEALSKGLPVITTDMCNAGIQLIKDGFNGYIVKSDDFGALGNAIVKVLNSDINSMSEYCIQSIQNYSLENMVDEHISIFEKVLKKR